MKIKKMTKVIALLVTMLFVLEGAAVATPVFAVDNTPTAEEALTQTSSGLDHFKLANLWGENKLKLNDKSLATVTSEETYGGIVVSGKISKLTELRFELEDELDFGELSAGLFVYNAVTQRNAKPTLLVYADNGEDPVARATITKQNKKGNWTVSRNLSVNLYDKKLTGKHKISFALSYPEDADGKTSTSVLLRHFFFTAQSVPLMEVNIDESEGTIAEMNSDDNHNTECYGNVTLNVPEGYKSEYSSKTYTSGTYELEYIRGRGNSTWMTSKRPYKLKFEKKQDFFGMGANKHWVLLANYYDFTMLRNKYTYWLGNEMGMEYTPQCVFIDLVMNGQYLGSYYLCEQVRVGKSRVDIDDLEDTPLLSEGDGLSGGYLMSLGYDEGDYRMVNAGHLSFLLENPEFSDYVNEAQYNYISDYVQKADEALYSPDFRNSEGRHYSEYIDVDAAIDYYFVQEFSLNGDAFGSGSTYLYKKRGGKLFWGPLWDFDYVAWGATEYYGNQVDAFYCNNTEWFNRMLRDPEFLAKLKARWQQLKPLLESSAADGGQIDKYALELYMSQKSNYYVINTVYDDSGSYYTYNYYDGYGGDSEQTEETHVVYDTEVQRFKRWIRERIEWFDQNLDSIIPRKYKAVFKADGKTVKSAEFYADYFYDEIPAGPAKKGYDFVGWFTKYGISTDDYYFSADEPKVVFYAKWIKTSENKLKNILFPYKDVYVYGYYNYDSYDYEPESYKIPISTMPFNNNVKLRWSCSDTSVATVDSYGYITPLVEHGKVKVTAKYGTLKATCTVHIGEDAPETEATLAKTKITLTKGNYSQIKIKDMVKAYWAYDETTFTSGDYSVVDVDSYGCIYGKKAGSTVVVVQTPGAGRLLICQVTVKPAPLKKGSTFTAGGLKYKVTKLSKTNTVTVTGAVKNTVAAVKIPATVKTQGKTFKVTAISAKAFKSCKKLKKVTITSKTIRAIGKYAFKTAKKLSFKLPATKKASYTKLLKKAKSNM